MPAPLPICVIGAGSIGMRHVDCAAASAAVTLTAVVENHAGQRERLAHLGLPIVADLADVPPETRAAIIATPTPNHTNTALACLDRGWAVLVEKPLAETTAQAQALCDRAAALALPLITGFHRRCHPFVAEARHLLPQLGDIVAIQGLWCLRKHDSYYDEAWRIQPGAGPILTNLSHEIDLLHCLAGPITEVTSIRANAARGLAVEDTAALTLRFASGALGSFILSDAGASPWAFEAATGENPAIAVRGGDPLRFVGTCGSLSFPSLRHWQASPGLPPSWEHPLAEIPGRDFPSVDGIAVQLDRFAAVAAGASDPILATGQDGLRSMAVLDAVQEAAQTGQTQKMGT